MVYVRYNDIWLRVIASVLAAHFIVMYGETVSLFQELFDPLYYFAMSYSIAIAFTLISFVRYVYLKLDRRFDWRKKPVERSALQILVGLVLPGILAFLMATTYFLFRGMNILKTLYLRFDYPVILILLLFLNLYYLAYYFYEQMRIAERAILNSPITIDESEDGSKKNFLVNQGFKSIPIPLDEIAYFYREGDYNFLRTNRGDDYTIAEPLDEVQQHLGMQNFFRANRQMLVSRKACKHFESLPFNKLQLIIEPPYKTQTIISQKRNKGFKEWLTI